MKSLIHYLTYPIVCSFFIILYPGVSYPQIPVPYDNWTTYDTLNGLPDNNTRFVMEDSKGDIWVGTSQGGVARLKPSSGAWTVFDTVNSGFSNNNASCIFEDHTGTIWAAFDQSDGIVAMYDGKNWTSNNPENIHVLTIFEDHLGNMWFGTWGYGVRKWDRATNNWTTYSTQNSGLPSDILFYGSIMEDSEYNMWFATLTGGLAKFDGTNWTVYKNFSAWGSLMDSQGNIWLAHGWTNMQGVTKFDGSNWTNYNTGNSGLTSDRIFNIFEDRNGHLWFGSQGNGVSKFNGVTWESYNMDNSGLTSNSIKSITEDANGDIWFATRNGLCKYTVPDQAIKVIDVVDFPVCGNANAQITARLKNIGSVTIKKFDISYAINGVSINPVEEAKINLPPGDTVEYVFSTRADLSVTGNYTLYVTTLLGGGIPPIDYPYETRRVVYGTDPYDNWTTYSTCDGLPYNSPRLVMEDSKGNIWMCTDFKGITKLDKTSGVWTIYNSENSGLSNNIVIDLFEDHEGKIWAALDFDDGIVATYDEVTDTWTSNNSDNFHVLTIFEDHENNMWFGTFDDGVRKWDRATNTWTTYTKENSGLPSNYLWFGAIMEDSENNMWFATIFDGLAKFDGTNWTIYNPDNSGMPSNQIWGALMDTHGNIWLAQPWSNNSFITKFDGSNWTVFDKDNIGLPIDNINVWNPFEDSKGNIWFGSWYQGLMKYDGNEWENLTMTNSGLTSNTVGSFSEDAAGDIWITTGNGLCVYQQGLDHMNFIASAATIDGVPMQPGDEIRIFDGNVRVGAGVLTEVLNGANIFEISVSLDDPSTPEKDGYTEGNPASFMLWDASKQSETQNYNITYISGNNVFANGATTYFQIKGYIETTNICYDEVFSGIAGTITDNSGTNNYLNNMDCQKLIQPENAVNITLSFIQFNTEKGKDIVYVYDGATTSAPLLGKFSGNKLPPSLTSTGGSMLIRFITNNSKVAQGWSAQYMSNLIPEGVKSTEESTNNQSKSIIDNEKIFVYPNPVREVLSIESNCTEEQVYTLELVNTSGQLVIYQKVSVTGGKYDLDVSSIECGLYLLRIITANHSNLVRVIKR